MSDTARIGLDPLLWLPWAVVAALLAVGALLAPVSASRVDGGPFRVDAGGVTGEAFTITDDDLACRDVQGGMTCTAQVGGRPLRVGLMDGVPSCGATHGDRRVGCDRFDAHGPESWLLRISDQLGVDAEEAAAWRARAPWWRTWTEQAWARAGLLLVAVLVAVAGAASWLLSARQRPALTDRQRFQFAAVVGLLGWLLPAANAALLFHPNEPTEFAAAGAVLVNSTLSAALLAWWQWLLGGSTTGRPAQRLMLTGAGMVLTLAYSGLTTLWLFMTAGIIG